jgi:hypothetical protein
MTYELWDTESHNVIGDFDSENEALAAVLEAVELNGEESVSMFTLLAAYDDGSVKGIAGGRKLVELARQHHAMST